MKVFFSLILFFFALNMLSGCAMVGAQALGIGVEMATRQLYPSPQMPTPPSVRTTCWEEGEKRLCETSHSRVIALPITSPQEVATPVPSVTGQVAVASDEEACKDSLNRVFYRGCWKQ